MPGLTKVPSSVLFIAQFVEVYAIIIDDVGVYSIECM